MNISGFTIYATLALLTLGVVLTALKRGLEAGMAKDCEFIGPVRMALVIASMAIFWPAFWLGFILFCMFGDTKRT